MSTPTLLTDRLLLRPWRQADATLQRQLWEERDPRVPPHRRIAPTGHPTVADLKARILTYDGTPTPGLLVAESHMRSIGYCGLIKNDANADEPELAFEFLRAVWNQGFATEASQAIVTEARSLGYRRLVSTVRVWNGASRRVLDKLGFSETGLLRPDADYGDVLTLTLAL
jgi:ribosomal-protein-alanine N-acetyltransferase